MELYSEQNVGLRTISDLACLCALHPVRALRRGAPSHGEIKPQLPASWILVTIPTPYIKNIDDIGISSKSVYA